MHFIDVIWVCVLRCVRDQIFRKFFEFWFFFFGAKTAFRRRVSQHGKLLLEDSNTNAQANSPRRTDIHCVQQSQLALWSVRWLHGTARHKQPANFRVNAKVLRRPFRHLCEHQFSSQRFKRCTDCCRFVSQARARACVSYNFSELLDRANNKEIVLSCELAACGEYIPCDSKISKRILAQIYEKNKIEIKL